MRACDCVPLDRSEIKPTTGDHHSIHAEQPLIFFLFPRGGTGPLAPFLLSYTPTLHTDSRPAARCRTHANPRKDHTPKNGSTVPRPAPHFFPLRTRYANLCDVPNLTRTGIASPLKTLFRQPVPAYPSSPAFQALVEVTLFCVALFASPRDCLVGNSAPSERRSVTSSISNISIHVQNVTNGNMLCPA